MCMDQKVNTCRSFVDLAYGNQIRQPRFKMEKVSMTEIEKKIPRELLAENLAPASLTLSLTASSGHYQFTCLVLRLVRVWAVRPWKIPSRSIDEHKDASKMVCKMTERK